MSHEPLARNWTSSIIFLGRKRKYISAHGESSFIEEIQRRADGNASRHKALQERNMRKSSFRMLSRSKKKRLSIPRSVWMLIVESSPCVRSQSMQLRPIECKVFYHLWTSFQSLSSVCAKCSSTWLAICAIRLALLTWIICGFVKSRSCP